MNKKVMILVGSGTQESRSLSLASTIAKSLSGRSVDVEVVDLLKLNLPQYDATTEAEKSWDAKTKQFLDESRDADGFVWVTPVYHNSYSSNLKTALDWQHFQLTNKVVGLASHAGRSTQPLDHLMMVARAQHAVVIPERVATNNDDYDTHKQVVDGGILSRIETFSDQFIEFLTRFHD